MINEIEKQFMTEFDYRRWGVDRLTPHTPLSIIPTTPPVALPEPQALHLQFCIMICMMALLSTCRSPSPTILPRHPPQGGPQPGDDTPQHAAALRGAHPGA
jgi:hypothetical protein